jgi:hypothetical protein
MPQMTGAGQMSDIVKFWEEKYREQVWRSEALEAALREIVYETTHLSVLEDDGSHNCRISKGALDQARAALAPETEK